MNDGSSNSFVLPGTFPVPVMAPLGLAVYRPLHYSALKFSMLVFQSTCILRCC